MRLLPKVMLGSNEELEYLDHCRQLLSLALVHPAFPHEDRDALTFWRSKLDAKLTDRQATSPPQQQQQQQPRPPPIPPRIRQMKTGNEEETRGPSPTSSSRIYIEGDLSHTLQDSPSYSPEPYACLEPYNADDEEVRTLTSKTLQPRQHASIFFGGGSGHTSPLPTGFEEGMIFPPKANTIPRVNQKEDPNNGLGTTIIFEWQAGMKGKEIRFQVPVGR